MKKAAEVLLLAKTWVNAGETDAALIVVEALWKNTAIEKNTAVLRTYLELVEKRNPLKTLDLLSQFIAAEGEFFELWKHSSREIQAFFLEWHGRLAMQLKDEAHARESLKRSAALGRDTLSLWSTLCVLSHRMSEFNECCEYFHRALRRYVEPSLFHEDDGSLHGESFFLGIALYLLPKISHREAQKVLLAMKNVFVGRPWLKELQEFVALEINQ